MKIVKFKGGLGNQLFQYAFLRLLEEKHKIDDIKADFQYYSNITDDSVRVPRIKKMNINISQPTENELNSILFFPYQGKPGTIKYKTTILLEVIANKRYFYEASREYRPIDSLLSYRYFDGYWQSWKYVNDIYKTIRTELVPKDELSSNTKNMISNLSNENAVFIGIRRGDYFSTKKMQQHYNIFTKEYYYSSIELIKKYVKNPVFYVFSNDIEWVKESISFKCDVRFRETESQTSDLEELMIMSACKHAIISNSTFYWWGAWLIDNFNKIIIAPHKWFADNKPIDILPPDWIKL